VGERGECGWGLRCCSQQRAREAPLSAIRPLHPPFLNLCLSERQQQKRNQTKNKPNQTTTAPPAPTPTSHLGQALVGALRAQQVVERPPRQLQDGGQLLVAAVVAQAVREYLARADLLGSASGAHCIRESRAWGGCLRVCRRTLHHKVLWPLTNDALAALVPPPSPTATTGANPFRKKHCPLIATETTPHPRQHCSPGPPHPRLIALWRPKGRVSPPPPAAGQTRSLWRRGCAYWARIARAVWLVEGEECFEAVRRREYDAAGGLDDICCRRQQSVENSSAWSVGFTAPPPHACNRVAAPACCYRERYGPLHIHACSPCAPLHRIEPGQEERPAASRGARRGAAC